MKLVCPKCGEAHEFSLSEKEVYNAHKRLTHKSYLEKRITSRRKKMRFVCAKCGEEPEVLDSVINEEWARISHEKHRGAGAKGGGVGSEKQKMATRVITEKRRIARIKNMMELKARGIKGGLKRKPDTEVSPEALYRRTYRELKRLEQEHPELALEYAEKRKLAYRKWQYAEIERTKASINREKENAEGNT